MPPDTVATALAPVVSVAAVPVVVNDSGATFTVNVLEPDVLVYCSGVEVLYGVPPTTVTHCREAVATDDAGTPDTPALTLFVPAPSPIVKVPLTCEPIDQV